jgi:hypothetical protein
MRGGRAFHRSYPRQSAMADLRSSGMFEAVPRDAAANGDLALQHADKAQFCLESRAVDRTLPGLQAHSMELARADAQARFTMRDHKHSFVMGKTGSATIIVNGGPSVRHPETLGVL